MKLRLREISATCRRFIQGDPRDVRLNEPGKALFRSLMWFLLALGAALIPAGFVSLLLAQVDCLSYVCGNLAGLLFTTAPTRVLWLLDILLYCVAGVFAQRSTLPRPIQPRRTQ